jgi:AcrR family transcriptional regulator
MDAASANAAGRWATLGRMPRIRAANIAEHKSRTRREILDAAADLFASQGYAETNLRDIAAYVGIGRTTLYEYFTGKEDVLVQLVEATMPALVDRLFDGLSHDAGCREQLTEIIQRGLRFVSTDDQLGSLVMREMPLLSPETQQRVRRVHGRLQAEITDVCRRGIEGGEFGLFDPEDAGRIVFTLMMSVSQALLRSAGAEERREEMADTLLRFVFKGLGA